VRICIFKLLGILKSLQNAGNERRRVLHNVLYKFMALMTPKDSDVNCYSFSSRNKDFDRLITAKIGHKIIQTLTHLHQDRQTNI